MDNYHHEDKIYFWIKGVFYWMKCRDTTEGCKKLDRFIGAGNYTLSNKL